MLGADRVQQQLQLTTINKRAEKQTDSIVHTHSLHRRITLLCIAFGRIIAALLDPVPPQHATVRWPSSCWSFARRNATSDPTPIAHSTTWCNVTSVSDGPYWLNSTDTEYNADIIFRVSDRYRWGPHKSCKLFENKKYPSLQFRFLQIKRFSVSCC